MLDSYDLVPSLPASDLERAKQFCSETLGLKVKYESPYVVEYQTPSEKFGVNLTASAGKAEHTLGAWEVEGIDAVAEQLPSRGVAFEEYDYPELKPSTGSPTWARNGRHGSKTPRETSFQSFNRLDF